MRQEGGNEERGQCEVGDRGSGVDAGHISGHRSDTQRQHACCIRHATWDATNRDRLFPWQDCCSQDD